MRLQVKSPDLLSKITCLLLIVVLYSFFCVNVSAFLYKFYYRGNLALALAFCLLLICFNASFSQKIYLKGYTSFVVVFLCIVTIAFVFSGLKYSFLDCYFVYFLNMAFVPVCYYALQSYFGEDSRKIYYFFRLLTVVNICCILVYFAQSVLYQYSGNLVLMITTRADTMPYMRNGRIRIVDSSDLIMVSYLISLILCFDRDVRSDKVLHIINLILCVFSFFFIQQTRMMQLVAVGTLCLLFFFKYRPGDWGIRFLKLLLILGCIYVLYSKLDHLQIDTSDGSYFARIGAIKYYMSMFSKSIISGFGFLNENRGTYFYQIHGQDGIFFPEDVGLFGTWVKFGLLSILWYISLMIYTLKKALRSKRCSVAYAACFFYLLMTSATLSLLDNTRLPVLALLFVLLHFLETSENREASMETSSQD